METATQVTIAIFMAAVIFAAGRFTARLEALEKWRDEVLARFDKLDRSILHLELLIRGEEK